MGWAAQIFAENQQYKEETVDAFDFLEVPKDDPMQAWTQPVPMGCYARRHSSASQVGRSVEHADVFEAWPLLAQATYTETILSPGDALYIPSGVWHYVRGLSVSLSVNFWF